MRQRLMFLGVAFLAMVVAGGCAITDYDGLGGRQTAAEAKLWGQEISFITGDPALDGTYSYTVKYDNRGGRDTKLTIISYRNPVPSSFSRDGEVDRDGDDVQGRSGILGGKFAPQWIAVDPAPDCQFEANVRPNGANGVPPIQLCTTVVEEIDKDLDLQASFSSLGDLLSQIWSGALNSGFTAEITGLTLGGVQVPLSQPLPLQAAANGIRPTRISVDLTGAAGHGLIQAILNNTSDGVPVSVGLNFAGGMSLDLPAHFRVAFDHDALWSLLN